MSNKEKAIRTAAEALHTAVTDAQAAGYAVEWPRTIGGLLSMPISETAKIATTAQVTTTGDVSDEVVSKAAVAATKAAERVVEKAVEKA